MLCYVYQVLMWISVLGTGLVVSQSIEQRQSGRLQIAFLSPVYQCQTKNLTWTGGVPPYTLIAQSSGSNFIPSDIPIISDTPSTYAVWTVAIPRGYTFRLRVTDSTGNYDEYTTLTVLASSNSSCLADTWPATSTSSRGSSPTSTDLPRSSSTSGSSSSSTASNTAGPGLIYDPNSAPSPTGSSSSNLEAIRLGAGIGGAVAIVLVILGMLYGCRRWKKRRTRLSRKLEPLDLTGEPDKEDMGIVVEPYSQIRQVDREATPLLRNGGTGSSSQGIGMEGRRGQVLAGVPSDGEKRVDTEKGLVSQGVIHPATAFSPAASTSVPSPIAVARPSRMPLRTMNPENELGAESDMEPTTAMPSSSPSAASLPRHARTPRTSPGAETVYVHDDAGPVGRRQEEEEGRVELPPVYHSIRTDTPGS